MLETWLEIHRLPPARHGLRSIDCHKTHIRMRHCLRSIDYHKTHIRIAISSSSGASTMFSGSSKPVLRELSDSSRSVPSQQGTRLVHKALRLRHPSSKPVLRELCDSSRSVPSEQGTRPGTSGGGEAVHRVPIACSLRSSVNFAKGFVEAFLRQNVLHIIITHHHINMGSTYGCWLQIGAGSRTCWWNAPAE